MNNITRKSKRKVCRICHKKFYKISQHGLCVKCSIEKMQLARLQIKQREGKIYEKWKKGMIEHAQKLI